MAAHIHDVLERVDPVASVLRRLTLDGALLLLHVRIFGSALCDLLEVSCRDLRRMAEVNAQLFAYSSAIESWTEIVERLNWRVIQCSGR